VAPILLRAALGLALLAPAADAKPKEKAAKPGGHEQAAPAAAPAPGSQNARPAAAGGPKRRAVATPQPTPAPTPEPTPRAPAATPAPPPPVPAAAPVAPAATPTQTPAPARRPARSRRPRAPVAAAPARRTAIRQFPIRLAVAEPPPVHPAAAVPRPRRERPVRAPRPAAAAPAGPARPSTAVAVPVATRVIDVIPAPLRIALVGLAFLAGLLALRARRLERQSKHLSDDLGLLQSALLPHLPERIGDAWVSAAYRPAEGLAAGGDFYDAFALGAGRTGVLVGDVAGHGRDAIPLTADVRSTLRAYLEAGLTPPAAIKATAEVLEPRLGGRFVTVALAVLDARTGRLTYATAGHPPPLLRGVKDRLLTASGCPAIGTGLPTGARQTTVALPPGATACFYTDGLLDAKARGRRVGPAGVARRLQGLGPGEGAAALLDRLVRETDAQPDDMAACLLRRDARAPACAAERVEELEVDDLGDGRARRFLAACDVPAAEADAALAAAHDLLPVVLTVRCGPDGGAVAVHRPDTVAMSLRSP
jgi:hypothetical protein